MTTTIYEYINNTGREYGIDLKVTSVTFPISERHFETLTFESAVSEETAIKAVESFLSEPMTEDFYKVIKDSDEIKWIRSFEEAKIEYPYRGTHLQNHSLDESRLNNGHLEIKIEYLAYY